MTRSEHKTTIQAISTKLCIVIASPEPLVNPVPLFSTATGSILPSSQPVRLIPASHNLSIIMEQKALMAWTESLGTLQIRSHGKHSRRSSIV